MVSIGWEIHVQVSSISSPPMFFFLWLVIFTKVSNLWFSTTKTRRGPCFIGSQRALELGFTVGDWRQ